MIRLPVREVNEVVKSIEGEVNGIVIKPPFPFLMAFTTSEKYMYLLDMFSMKLTKPVKLSDKWQFDSDCV